jgi:hypothetical protein
MYEPKAGVTSRRVGVSAILFGVLCALLVLA